MSTRLLSLFVLLGLAGAGYGGYLLLASDEPASSAASRPSRRSFRPAVVGESRPNEAASRETNEPPPSAEPAPGSVRGRVVDRGGIAITHAVVTADLRTPPGERNYALVADYRAQAKVDAEGRFAFDVPGGGVYRFSSEAEGFAPGVREGVRPGEEIELIADVGAVLEVRAVDKLTEKPVAGVSVVLRAPKSALLRRGKTGADGLSRFVDLPAGQMLISSEHDEYVPRENVERILDVGEAAVFALELDPGKSIKGQVLSSEEQRPIEGATIVVLKKKAVTDAGGRFLVKGLAPAPQQIQTVAEGYLANERSVNLAGSRAQAECEIFLERGATIKGRVVNDLGEGLPDVEIKLFESWGGGEDSQLWEDWSSRHLKTKTLADGVFKISGIMPQGWSQRTLRARHPTYADAFERGLKLAKKEDELYLSITMRPGGVISGRVIDEQSRAIAGARVELRARDLWEGYDSPEVRADGSEVWREKNLSVMGSDAEGNFSFTNLSEGKYELRVEAKGWSTAYRGDLKLSRAGRIESLMMTLEKGEPLRGYVVDGEEKPLAGANVYVNAKNGNAQAVTGADGTFQIETIPKGPYDVGASATGYAQTNLRKQMPEGERGLRIVLKRQGVVRGKVVDVATKKPVVGAWLSLQKEEPRWGNSMREWAWAQSDKQGEFKLQADNGTYRLTCGAEGYVRFRKDDVTVSSDASEPPVVAVELKRGGAIEGIVRGPDGKPDGGVTIWWRKDDGAELFTNASNTETDGYYFCGDLDAGSYELVYQRPGYPLQIQKGVYVGGDRPAEVDVLLRYEATLEMAIVWLDPPKPPASETSPGAEVAAAASPSPARESTAAAGPPKPRRTPRPNIWIEALDDVPVSMEWENRRGEESGQRLGRKRYVWLGGGQKKTSLSDLPAGRYRVRAQASGHEEFTTVFSLSQGGKSNVEIRMQAMPGYVPPGEPRMRRGSWTDEEGNVHYYNYQEDG